LHQVHFESAEQKLTKRTVINMARIEGIDPKQAPFLMRQMFRKVRKMLGRDLTPQRIQARVPRLFWFGILGEWLLGQKAKVSARLRAVVTLRTAANHMHIRFVVVLFIIFAGISAVASAQTGEEPERPLQIGTQFSVLHVDPLHEDAVSVGVRASYDLPVRRLTVAPEIEANYFPQVNANFGEKQVLAGARAGFKLDAFGFFFKVRPGLVHFGGAEFTTRNGGSLSTFATDIGGVFEYYVSPRVALRLDWGDTMIYFPNPIATAISPSKAPGWYHNLQGSGGVSFRF